MKWANPCVVRQAARIAHDKGAPAVLRRHGADTSPAPAAAPCPHPLLVHSRAGGSLALTATCRTPRSRARGDEAFVKEEKRHFRPGRKECSRDESC